MAGCPPRFAKRVLWEKEKKPDLPEIQSSQIFRAMACPGALTRSTSGLTPAYEAFADVSAEQCFVSLAYIPAAASKRPGNMVGQQTGFTI